MARISLTSPTRPAHSRLRTHQSIQPRQIEPRQVDRSMDWLRISRRNFLRSVNVASIGWGCRFADGFNFGTDFWGGWDESLRDVDRFLVEFVSVCWDWELRLWCRRDVVAGLKVGARSAGGFLWVFLVLIWYRLFLTNRVSSQTSYCKLLRKKWKNDLGAYTHCFFLRKNECLHF